MESDRANLLRANLLPESDSVGYCSSCVTKHNWAIDEHLDYIPPPNVVKFGDYSSKPGNWPHPTTIKKQEGFTPRPSRRRRYSHPTIAKKEEGFTPHTSLLLIGGGGV